MFTRLNKVYHEFPRLFWIVVAVRFVDGIGGTLLFPFFALYITQKFGVGMTEAGIMLGMSSLFGTCDNMHGSQNVRLLRVGYSIGESCTSCHPEKRGPFLWEHPPVRENCATCHDPHGSANERLLVAKQPFLCQRCHVHSRHPATIYDDAVFKSSNRVYGRGCVNCHSAIHGSVHPAGMAFQR